MVNACKRHCPVQTRRALPALNITREDALRPAFVHADDRPDTVSLFWSKSCQAFVFQRHFKVFVNEETGADDDGKIQSEPPNGMTVIERPQTDA
jgi:hypothetical protein